MSLLQPTREPSESVEEHPASHADEQRSDSGEVRVTVTEERTVTDSALFTLGRVLYGGILAFMAVDNLRNLEERIGYADAMGAPMPSLSVPAISSSLLVGSVGIVLWRAPVAAASAVAAFFLSTTPVMHDFWTVDDPEEKQTQMLHFLKNTALLGAAMAFLGLGRDEE